MLRLRTYKPVDAKTILTWCKDEISFRKWTSDRYDSYPITAEDMNRKYVDFNGDCVELDNFFPMTAFDESGVVGHLIMVLQMIKNPFCVLDSLSWMIQKGARVMEKV